MKNLIILQSITPDYRKTFFALIKKTLKDDFQLYSGDSYFELSLKDDKSIEKIKVRNYFILNRFLIQSHFLKLIFKKGILVLEMNPRILTNWFILIIRKLANKKTILWGHAWPREGKNSKTEKIRKIMKSLGDEIIVYTNQQREELQIQFPKKNILAASNSVIEASLMGTTNDLENNYNIIYVGRLTKLKKPMLLVKAFHSIVGKITEKCNLIIVGSGEELECIKEYITKNNLTERIFLKGHVSDYLQLKEMYDSSLCSVSPGYVGLSITQSFGFGVPMIVSKTENHSPEIEAFKEGENGVYFRTNDIIDLGNKIKQFLKEKNKWDIEKENIVDFCRENYSTESMAETFINLVR